MVEGGFNSLGVYSLHEPIFIKSGTLVFGTAVPLKLFQFKSFFTPLDNPGLLFQSAGFSCQVVG